MASSLLHRCSRRLLAAISVSIVLALGIFPALAQTLPDRTPDPSASGEHFSKADLAQAEPLLRSSLAAQLANLDTAAAGQSEREQLAAMAQVRSALGAYLDLASRAPQFQESGYRYVLAWKGAVFTRQRAMRAARSEPELQSVCDELQNVASRLAALARSDKFAPDPAVWQWQVAALSEKKEQLEKLLAGKSSGGFFEISIGPAI